MNFINNWKNVFLCYYAELFRIKTTRSIRFTQKSPHKCTRNDTLILHKKY